MDKTASDCILTLFTRYPQPGTTKTRLIPQLGSTTAARIHNELTHWTLRRSALAEWQQQIAYSGHSREAMRDWLGEQRQFVEQCGQNLGERMANVLQQCHARGFQRAAIIGSDCPELDSYTIQQAFDRLKEVDIVVGPAEDGGYYLIACNLQRLNHRWHELFHSIPWGSANVLKRQCTQIQKLGLKMAELPRLWDVDHPHEVARFFAYQLKQGVSIVIPTLNEADNIASKLSLQRQSVASMDQAAQVEWVVVDGGSRDGTRAIAQDHADLVLDCPGGRGLQMRKGAEASRGGVLLFVHADSVFNRDGLQDLIAQTQDPLNVASVLSLSIDSPKIKFRFLERCIDFRSRILGWPYGDQGLCIRRSTYDMIGGYPPQPLMEDVELIRRLKRQGRIHHSRHAMKTADRRWQKRGIIHNALSNQFYLQAYRCGVSPNTLAKWYHKPSLASPEKISDQSNGCT